MRSMIIVLLLFCFLWVGYGLIGSGERVTAWDILNQNKDADMIKYKGNIYTNATELEWFEKENSKLQKGGKIGEIKKVKSSPLFFGNFSATKLPKGTTLYSTNNGQTGVIIVETENGEFLYYIRQLIE